LFTRMPSPPTALLTNLPTTENTLVPRLRVKYTKGPPLLNQAVFASEVRGLDAPFPDQVVFASEGWGLVVWFALMAAPNVSRVLTPS